LLFCSEGLASLADALGPEPETISIGQDSAGCAYERFISSADERIALPAVAPLDPWLMLYTSGTTRRHKGCLRDQLGPFVGAQSLRAAWHADAQSRLGLSLPLFHVGGLSILLAHMLAGATTFLAPRHFGALEAVEFLVRHRCTAASLAPQLFEGMRDHLQR